MEDNKEFSLVKLLENTIKLADALETIGKGIYKLVTDVLPEISEKFIKFIQELDVPEYNYEQKQELISSYKKWGEYGWSISPSMSIMEYKLFPNSQEEADTYILNNYNVRDEISKIVEFLKKSDINQDDFDEAYFCYENQKYKACSMVLFSILDNKLIGLGFKYKGRRATGYSATMKLNKDIENNKDENILFHYLYYINLIETLKSLFKDADDFKLEQEFVNRNLLDHGMAKKPITETDCYRVFCALYTFMELTSMDKIIKVDNEEY